MKTADGETKEMPRRHRGARDPSERDGEPRPSCGSTARGAWSSSPAIRASRTPRAASSRRSSAPCMMVFLMSFAVAPLGVLAALYLREYAKQGPLVRMVRIAVNNLAGVPSIVFGVFGLGFFVYLVGGTHRPRCSSRGAADADLRHRRHPVGGADAGAADRAGGHRGGRGGAGGGAAHRARGRRWPSAPPSSRPSGGWCCRRRRRAS